ncbi:MAG: class I SAM-dependent RNA methyltransferase [Cytophagales bacterium]|nr:MAG: class I SAM-dependent RNA methyltransferase [Cytophagales bacterium]TAF61507.1 MAG: class I SAM-dependent RNA methyltransferase [Cytophagales bacterium]
MIAFLADKKPQFSIIAKTFFGLEDVLARELFDLGASDVEVLNRSVIFEGSLEVLYKANLHLRTALRLIVPFYTFRVRDEQDIYDELVTLPWHDYLTADQSFAVDVVINTPLIKHSQYAMHLAKDAIVDEIREKTGARPSVDLKTPHLRLNLHVFKDVCTLSLDSTGDSLHKRGYRQETNEAPINEVLAAGMVLLSGWQRDCDFIDPMCGSGTILIEAAQYAHRIAPAQARMDFDFMKWPNYDEALWLKIKEEADNNELEEFDHYILGSDISERNINICKQNVRRAGLQGKISLFRKDFLEFEPPQTERGVCVMNPPYGERMATDEIENFYKSIGDTLKKKFKGYKAWLICSNEFALKHVGLKAKDRMTLYNGALECKYHSYELYEGSYQKPSSSDESGAETEEFKEEG